jgi:hypothetical protein
MDKTWGYLRSVLLTNSILVINREEWFGRVMWHFWGRAEVHTEFWRRKLRERDHFEDIGIDRRIILKWIFKTWNGDAVDWCDSGSGWVASCCECGIEPSGSIKRGDYFSGRNGGVLWRRPRPGRGCSAIDGWTYLAEGLLPCEEGPFCMELVGWLVKCLMLGHKSTVTRYLAFQNSHSIGNACVNQQWYSVYWF